jgi:hypothetical protein
VAKDRKYKKESPSEGKFRDSRLFVVVTEGTKTEELYFQNLASGSRRIRVLALKAEEISHGPQFVAERIRTYENRKGINSDVEEDYPDIIWVVYDRDPQTWSEAQLAILAGECKQNGWGWAFSNPCFEIWLLLHCHEPTEIFDKCQPVKTLTGEKSKGCYLDKAQNKKLMEDIPLAIDRAAKLDTDKTNDIPAPNCTRVYQLAQQMLDFMKLKGI